MKSLFFKMILSVVLCTTHIYAQVVQDSSSQTLSSFQAKTRDKVTTLKSASLGAGIPITFVGAFLVFMFAIVKGSYPEVGSPEYAEAHVCTRCTVFTFGSFPFLIASTLVTTVGLMILSYAGFSWLAIDKQMEAFDELEPYPVMECHLLTPFAPANIRCSSDASFAQATDASLVASRDWNFDDGLGFQSMGAGVSSYTLNDSRNYTIQVRVKDTNGRNATRSFLLNVPNASDVDLCSLAKNYTN